jgi:hypothetical protein
MFCKFIVGGCLWSIIECTLVLNCVDYTCIEDYDGSFKVQNCRAMKFI